MARTWGEGWTLEEKRYYLKQQVKENARVAGNHAAVGSVVLVENELAIMRRAIDELMELAQ